MASVEAVSNLLLDFDDPKAFLDYVSVRSEEEKKLDCSATSPVGLRDIAGG